MSQIHQESEIRSYSTPRWVKIFGGIIIALIVLFAAMHVFIGGIHGNHQMPSASMTEMSTPSTAQETTQP